MGKTELYISSLYIYLKIRFLDSSIFLSHRGRKKNHVQIFWRSVHYLLEPTQKPICFRSYTAADHCQVNQKRTGKNSSYQCTYLKRKYNKILYYWFSWVLLHVLKEKVSQDIPVLSFRISVADPNPFQANPGPAFCDEADPDPHLDPAFYAKKSKFT